ncbi:MAG: ABC transporter ATP-binding protein, partial [Oscillospiraceae bacterium]|nr:ABC transporter ATP-binding protein [Oscillospiraceae bacterium]
LRYIAACANDSGDTEKRIREVLEVTGMTEGAKRRIKGYSRGMNQRLGIAAAMFDNPELLILDEPTSALDPEGRAEVMNIILNLKRSGVTIILCTHIITDVERVADKIGIMKDGVIVEEASIDTIMAKYRNQAKELSVRLAEPHPDTASPMRMLPSVNSSHYNGMNGVVTLGSENIDLLYEELIALIHEKKIKISELIAQKTTLEDVYFAITGLKGGQGA